MPKMPLLDHYRSVRAHARLLNDLGPLTPDAPIWSGVSQTRFHDAPAGVSAQMFAPLDIPTRGAVFLIPGLHFAGPDDARMRRFCRALARAGMFVFAPYLPTYSALKTEASVIAETKAAFASFSRSPHRPLAFKPMVFSVSFGSLPAFALAADATYASSIGGVVTFGGFARFENAMTFCLGAHAGSGTEGDIMRDPLNLPIIYLNLAAHLDAAPEVIKLASDAWNIYVRRTWGRPEFKTRDRFVPLAQQMAETLPPEAAVLFLAGCGVGDNATARARDALTRMPRRDDFDPARYINALRLPVAAFHGRDDDVIPHTELDVLQQLMPAHVDFVPYKTGLFDHTRSAGSGAATISAALAEARTMLAMLNTLVRFSGHRFS